MPLGSDDCDHEIVNGIVTEAPSAGACGPGAVGAAPALPGMASTNSRTRKKTGPRNVRRGGQVGAIGPPMDAELSTPPAPAGCAFLPRLRLQAAGRFCGTVDFAAPHREAAAHPTRWRLTDVRTHRVIRRRGHPAAPRAQPGTD